MVTASAALELRLPDGSVRTVEAGTTPLDVARSIGPRLADAAVGTPGDSGHCRDSHSFTNGSSLDLDSMSCVGSADSFTNLTLYRRQGNNTTEYRAGTHFVYDPIAHEITWFSGNAPDVTVEFDWSEAGSEGKCGSRDPDPNGVCLVLSWQGVRVAGSLPGAGRDFGLRAVRLDG